MEFQHRAGPEYQRQAARLTAQAQAANLPPPTAAEIGTAVADALMRNPITATVTPHDAAHAASGAPPR